MGGRSENKSLFGRVKWIAAFSCANLEAACVSLLSETFEAEFYCWQKEVM